MASHSMSDVQAADRLYDEMPLERVSERHPASRATILRWAQEGLISTEENHHTCYSQDTIERADRLWDRMPLEGVSEVLGVPIRTLKGWSRVGWISTEVDWARVRAGPDHDTSPRRTAELYYGHDLTYKEVADRLGISTSTVSRHLRSYRNGNC